MHVTHVDTFRHGVHRMAVPRARASLFLPGEVLIPVLHQALLDFFSRSNVTSPEGNKDLPYHLFTRTSKAYQSWSSVAGPLGLELSEVTLRPSILPGFGAIAQSIGDRDLKSAFEHDQSDREPNARPRHPSKCHLRILRQRNAEGSPMAGYCGRNIVIGSLFGS